MTGGTRYRVALTDVRPLASLAEDSGVAFVDLLTGLGLPADLLSRSDDASISLGDYFRLLEQVAAAIQDETCHLSSRPLLPGSTHFAWSSIAGADQLADAMKRVAKAYNMLHGGHYNHVELRPDAIAYVIDDRAFPYSPHQDASYIHFTMECVLAFLHGTLMLIAGDALQAHLRKVHSRRPRAIKGSGQIDFLAAPVRWNAPGYALIYDLPAAFLPVDPSLSRLPSPDAVYRKIIARLEVEGAGNAGRCRDQVAARLRQGMRGQASIAADMAMSVATLRRRLEAEGTCFRVLRHEVLAQTAKAMLEQGAHVADIAEQLDFADFRSFSRAFKHWTGKTPAAYQARTAIARH